MTERELNTEPDLDRPPIRSRLYVPGTRVAWVEKAVASGADAVILDLDDGVASHEKDDARRAVSGAISEASCPVPLFVRINDIATQWALDDLEAVVQVGLFGIVVPRVSNVRHVVALDLLLSWLELRAGMPDGTVVLSPIFESAAALHFAYEIAMATPRVEYVGGIASDGGDIEREIGYRWSASAWESVSMRSHCLVELRAAGISNPLTGVWTSLEDPVGFRAFAEQSRDIGYVGMDVIHPSHVDTVNEVFSYNEALISRAEQLLELVDDSNNETGVKDQSERNIGAARLDGRMVDAAMVRTAKEILRRAGRLQ